MEQFYVFSVKFNGWVSPSGTYTSLHSEARTFTQDEAINFCVLRLRMGQTCFPVRVDTMHLIKELANGTR